MPVELRKRKAHQQPSAAPPAKKKTATKVADKVKKAAAPKSEPDAANGKKEEVQEDKKVVEKKPVAKKPAAKKANTSKGPSPGDVVKLDDFGGVVETNDGEKTTLKELVAKSKRGVVLFTYPKASTPGCTVQVSVFRDNYDHIEGEGLAIYGLSSDSTKANTSFKTKRNLQYPLLCDPSATLISAIGLKKIPSGTQRGVFVIDKEGKVLVAEPGGPEATLARVLKLIKDGE